MSAEPVSSDAIRRPGVGEPAARNDDPPAGVAALSLRGTAKHYRDAVAVHEVSLDVMGGEFVTLLGPSGSGKSTLIQMIAGFTEPTSGEIWVQGRSMTGVPPHRRRIGVVFQNYALFPHMTAYGNVAFSLRMRREAKKEIDRKVREALDLVGLAQMRDRYPRQLSGGQQQRVALARALVFEPRLLLMDEPLAALDKRMRSRLQGDIVRIQKQLGISVIYVTHDQEEAFVMSDRIAIMNEGRLMQIGTAQELYERPATAFVADFVGDSNIIYGAIGPDGGSLLVEDSQVRIAVSSSAFPDDRVAAGPGQRVALMVRPNRVRVNAAGSAEDSRFSGVVESVAYLGTTKRSTMWIPEMNARIISHVAAEADLPVVTGQSVSVSWNPDDCIVLAD